MERYLLTKEDAMWRRSEITNVNYEIRIFMGFTEYNGIVKITFEGIHDLNKIWMDFKGEKVEYVKVQGDLVEFKIIDFKIWIEGLKKGENEIEIGFSNNYSRDGFGLHTFKDPGDDKIYIYSHLEPFSANRFFPCFDQPDLKGPVTFFVKCPKSWSVISNEPVFEIPEDTSLPFLPLSENLAESELKTMKSTIPYPISTYIIALCAGEFVQFTSPSQNPPISLYVRSTLSTLIQPELYFRYALTSISYYNEFFDYNFPFSKLDLVFVPEFVIGAMENVGCITFNERYICRGSEAVSPIGLQTICNLVLHEISHMWFGDLVSVVWWDDIWLKESFATFMASLCIYECFPDEFPNVWKEFSSSKTWGYKTDQLSTTHPISVNVKDSSETRTNFDGISYSKGSAVLKQLYFVTGKEIFKRACSKYVNKFQHSVAQYSDFIETIVQESKSIEIDLRQWSQEWILTGGLNVLEPVLDPNSGLIVLQTAALANFGQLRSHSLYIDVYNSNFELLKQHKALVQGERTLIAELNSPDIKIIILNSDDWDYCKVRLDETTLAHLEGNICRIPNALNRMIVYRALLDMVLDGKITQEKYILAMSKEIVNESDFSAFNFLTTSIHNVIFSYYSNAESTCEYCHMIFSALKSKILTGLEKDLETVAFSNLIEFIYHKDDVDEAIAWLQKRENVLNDHVLSFSDKIYIIKEFSVYDESAIEILKDFKESISTYGFNFYFDYCYAKIPDAERKMEVWNNLMNNGERMSRYERKNIMAGFNDLRQKQILEPFGYLFFDNLQQVALTKDREFVIDYVSDLIPNYMGSSWVLEKLKSSLESFPKDQFEAYRLLKERLDVLSQTIHTQS